MRWRSPFGGRSVEVTCTLEVKNTFEALHAHVRLAGGVVIGGVASWLGQGRYRTAARRASAEVREAQAENTRLRTELDIQSRQNREAERLAGTAPTPLPALELHHAG